METPATTPAPEATTAPPEATTAPAPAPAPASPNKATHVLMVLDSSGSMQDCREAAIQHFNEQVKTLASVEAQMGKTDVTLVLLGAKPLPGEHDPTNPQLGQHMPGPPLIRTVFEAQPVSTLAPLTKENYEPHGNTPLFSAVARAMEIGSRIDGKGADEAFLLVIVTDGFENASDPKDIEALPNLVKAARDSKRWTFQMMGANIDVVLARRMGLQGNEFARYAGTPDGTRRMSGSLSKSSVGYARNRATGQTSQQGLGVEDDPNARPKP